MNLGYEFENIKLLNLAMTHISYAKDRGISSNQRLEFLGDSVLSLIITTYIYNNYPDLTEGELTEFRSNIVCEDTLAQFARNLDLCRCLKLGNSELNFGRNKPSILADTFEAVLGAIYLDKGLDAAFKWCINLFIGRFSEFRSRQYLNAKTILQEHYQKTKQNIHLLKYVVENKGGPDHMPSFVVNVVYDRKVLGSGKGRSIKLAEREAAKDAIVKMGIPESKY